MLPVLWASASLSQQGTAAGFAFHLEAVGEKVPVLSTVHSAWQGRTLLPATLTSRNYF